MIWGNQIYTAPSPWKETFEELCAKFRAANTAPTDAKKRASLENLKKGCAVLAERAAKKREEEALKKAQNAVIESSNFETRQKEELREVQRNTFLGDTRAQKRLSLYV